MRRCVVRFSATDGFDQRTTVQPYVVKEGERYVTIRRLTHPIRNQSIMLVPVPSFSTREFYDEWCYQPYVKHHTFVVCEDITTPTYSGWYHWFVSDSSKIQAFFPGNLPTPAALGISRKEFSKRFQFLKASFLRLTFLTAKYRDKTCERTVIEGLRGLFDQRYIYHSVSLESSSEDSDMQYKDSFVLLLNSSWVPHAIHHLEKEYGFHIDQEVEVPVGPHEELGRVEHLCHRGNVSILMYIGAQFVIIMCGLFNYFLETGRREWTLEQEKRGSA